MNAGPGDYFHTLRYLRSNARRLEFLASLQLPLEGRTVLEIGAGIGDLTSFFLDRGCSVTSVEPRSENVSHFTARYANDPLWPEDRLRIVQSDVAALPRHDILPHEVVFCFGTFNELSDPAGALAVLAPLCSDLFILEAAVESGPRRYDDAVTFHPVEPADPRASIDGCASVATRRWVREQVRAHFAHVYVTLIQPYFDRNRLFWREPSGGRGRDRVIFVASRSALNHPFLVDGIPDFQYREFTQAGAPAPFEFERLLAHVKPGSRVVDLDPAHGRYSVGLAAAALPGGTLIATQSDARSAEILQRCMLAHERSNVTIVPHDVRTSEAYRHLCSEHGGRPDVLRVHARRLHLLLEDGFMRELATNGTLLFVEEPRGPIPHAHTLAESHDFRVCRVATRD